MSTFQKNGFRTITKDIDKAGRRDLKQHWQQHASTITEYPGGFLGKGIVLCAGGVSYFTCCWIAIHMIREQGCSLPIELWYVGNELSPEVRTELEKLNVRCRDHLADGGVSLSGWILKPISIIRSSFREVLFLDADNICVKDPEELFRTKEYLEHGALFWPDYWQTPSDNPIWAVTGVRYNSSKEQESGQLLVDKEKCWKELNLSFYFNKMGGVYYNLIWGDKDTFRFSWMALKKPFHMISTDPGVCGYTDQTTNEFLGTTIVQHNTNGDICFLHRNLLKWDITRSGEKVWQTIKRHTPNARTKEYHLGHSEKNGHYYMDLMGDVDILNYNILPEALEEKCLKILEKLRLSPFYGRYLMHAHFAAKRYSHSVPFLL